MPLFFHSLIVILLLGCTRVPPANDACVNMLVDSRIDKRVHWVRDSCEAGEIACFVQNLLATDLTLSTAVQIALLNNPEIQAVFEELGIARADLIEAGLLSNPMFEGLVRFPDPKLKGLVTNIEIAALQNILDIFLIPIRQKVAGVEYQQAQLRIANTALNLAFEVEETFYSLQAAQARVQQMTFLVELSEAASELAIAQRARNNINDLEMQFRIQEFLEAKVELSKSQLEIVTLREKMNKLLGLYSTNACWQICENLPQLPENEPSDECLEELALSQRFDLQVAAWEVEQLVQMFGLNQWWAYTKTALGVSHEKDVEGNKDTGPAYTFELPLFNYGQADRERLRAMLRQSIDRYYAKEIEVLAEIRSAKNQMMINRRLVLDYVEEIMPLQRQTVEMSQRFYNFMTLSVYKLLNAKRQEIQMQINYTLLLRDYWLSRVELDRALGGNLYIVLSSLTSQNEEDCK